MSPAELRLLELELEYVQNSWLANLPVYLCPGCGAETIFKDGCSKCEGDDE